VKNISRWIYLNLPNYFLDRQKKEVTQHASKEKEKDNKEKNSNKAKNKEKKIVF
jgi:hypothetical protein